jgi:HD domain
MVRSSDIIRKDVELRQKKTDSTSDFLRLSDIFKLSGGESPIVEQNVQPEKIDIHSVYDIYLKIHDYMQDIQNSLKNQTPFKIDPALDSVRKIINTPGLLDSICSLTLDYGHGQDYYLFQPIHTMIYSLMTGMGMKYTTTQLSELGLSSLLQNIGMFLIPDEVINKNGRLTDYEMGLIKKHPEIGTEILQPFQKDYPWLLESVYQHHERENGQGYPRGLKGEETIDKRPHKQPITQFTSIKQLIESKEGLFSPQILKVFLESMSLYPVGSYVTLNNGAIGRVIEINKSHSMKPVIHLLFDGNGEKAPYGSIINLSENNVLNIASVIAEKDLPGK